ncbi:hypothetical protein CC86DRAFT_370977, partial [Ophiobolus disseminans]
MYTPPYSPLASYADRCTPHYSPIIWDKNPFDTISFPESPLFRTSHDDDLIAPADLPTAKPPSRIPLVTSRTFPTYNDPWKTIRRAHAFEPPQHTPALALPTHNTVTSQTRTFRLDAPFIYPSSISNIPHYQFSQDATLGILKIRCINLHEIRASSLPSIYEARKPKIEYDDQETIYSFTSTEMHGKDLPGSIHFTSGSTLWGEDWVKLWHVHRASKMCDGDKTLLYTIKKGVWEDGGGGVVAREENGALEVSEAWARRSNLVVGCWVLKGWCEGEWDGIWN